MVLALAVTFSVYAAPLDPSSPGIGGQSLSGNYDALLDGLYSSGNATTTVNGNLWVPWYNTSTSCTVADLHSGASCNSGETIDATHNCMVTDEFSQVGILVSMGQNPARMSQYFGTVNAIASTHDQLPGWRVYRSGNAISACKSGINGNCDTASDADARIIISLYTASANSAFSSGERTLYAQLATNLSAAFLKNEVAKECHQSNLGYGDICYWLAAGSGAKSGGLGATDFGYTGYYPDAIIAMLAACGQTGNQTYCAVAGNFTLNYLQASNWDGTHFSVPPGRSFKWTNTGTGQVPTASCTNTCSPDQWDYADASRATGLCGANYYATLVGVTLPGLPAYCAQWSSKHLSNPTSIPIQYFSDGTNSASYQSGFFAQGLEALFEMGGNQANLPVTITSALGHYNTNTKMWDNTACFGVYTEAFAIRALGASIGRDQASFPAMSVPGPMSPPATPANGTNGTTPTSANNSNSTQNTTGTTTNGTITNGTGTPPANTTTNTTNHGRSGVGDPPLTQNTSTTNTTAPLPAAPPNSIQESNTTATTPPANESTNSSLAAPAPVLPPAPPKDNPAVTSPRPTPPPPAAPIPPTPPVTTHATPPIAEAPAPPATATGDVTIANTKAQHLSSLQVILLMIGMALFVSLGLVYVIETSSRYPDTTLMQFGERTAQFIKTLLPPAISSPQPAMRPLFSAEFERDATALLTAAAMTHEREPPNAWHPVAAQEEQYSPQATSTIQESLTDQQTHTPYAKQESNVWDSRIFAE